MTSVNMQGLGDTWKKELLQCLTCLLLAVKQLPLNTSHVRVINSDAGAEAEHKSANGDWQYVHELCGRGIRNGIDSHHMEGASEQWSLCQPVSEAEADSERSEG